MNNIKSSQMSLNAHPSFEVEKSKGHPSLLYMNFIGVKRLVIVSKSLFDLKVKGYQGIFWVAI